MTSGALKFIPNPYHYSNNFLFSMNLHEIGINSCENDDRNGTFILGSITSRSIGVVNFRMSHQRTCYI